MAIQLTKDDYRELLGHLEVELTLREQRELQAAREMYEASGAAMDGFTAGYLAATHRLGEGLG